MIPKCMHCRAHVGWQLRLDGKAECAGCGELGDVFAQLLVSVAAFEGAPPRRGPALPRKRPAARLSVVRP